jgi:hypothetical protein
MRFRSDIPAGGVGAVAGAELVNMSTQDLANPKVASRQRSQFLTGAEFEMVQLCSNSGMIPQCALVVLGRKPKRNTRDTQAFKIVDLDIQ